MKGHDDLDAFVAEHRQRMLFNRGIHLSRTWLILTPLLTLPAVAAALAQGYRPDPYLSIGIVIVCIVAFGAILFTRQPSRETTLSDADRHHKLKQGLLSAEGFRRKGRTGELIDRQLEHTIAGVEQCSPLEREFLGWKTAGVATALIAATLFLHTLDESPDVKAARIEAEQNFVESSNAIEEIEEIFEEVEQGLTEEEKELLENSGLLEELEQLEASEDFKETLKALAALEHKLNQAGKDPALEQDEAFWKELGQELKSPSLASLSRSLEQQDFKAGSENLQEMKLDPSGNQRYRKLKSIEDLAKGMKELSASGTPSRFDESIDEMLQECEACQGGNTSKMSKLNSKLARMSKNMDDIDTRRSFSSKMEAMARALAGLQEKMMKPGEGPGMGAGDAATDYFPTAKDPQYALSQNQTSVDGADGEGPSQTTVTEASTGEGKSRLQARQRAAVEYQHHLESLISRDDVPLELKSGVKKYFEFIHQPSGEDQP